MPGRTFVCAIVMMGIAMPAAAGERPGYSPAPDALRLLLQDDHATAGPQARPVMRAPGIAAPAEPLPDTLTRFEALMLPMAALPGGQGGDIESPFALEASEPVAAWRPAALESMTSTFGARYAISDAMRNHQRPRRRYSALDTMLTFRLDGEEETRSFSVGGAVAGAVWRMLPKQ
ncbi:MAG: hypothetical protein V4574_13370 [Pseudomonadota bacterium]